MNNIKLFFNTKRKITNDKGHLQFSVSSKKDIQKVVNFFSFSNNHPLLGQKLISYNLFLNKLKNSSRYKNINIPIS